MSKGNCNCKSNGMFAYNPLYDARYCTNCYQWLEGTCSDPNCEYCVNRPENPPKHMATQEGEYYLFDDGSTVAVPEF